MTNTSRVPALNSKRAPLRRRYFTLAILSFVLPGFLCGCLSKENASQATSDLTQEELLVYSGLLDALSTVKFKYLANTTTVFDPSELEPGSICLQGLHLEKPNEPRRSVHLLSPEILKGRNLELVDSRRQASLVEAADSAARQGGDSKEQPQAALSEHGFLVLSEIAFDKTHRFAVLKYDFVCGAHCSTSQTYVMEKVGDRWEVKGRPCTMVVN